MVDEHFKAPTEKRKSKRSMLYDAISSVFASGSSNEKKGSKCSLFLMAFTSAFIFGFSIKPANADMPSHLRDHRPHYHSRTIGVKRHQIKNLEKKTTKILTEQ